MALLISLNIERSKHLDRIIPFLRAQQPDIVCFQELMARDVTRICAQTSLAHAYYTPMALHPLEEATFGLGIFSRTPFTQKDNVTIAGVQYTDTIFDRSSPERRLATSRYAVSHVTVPMKQLPLRIATTHLPWTPDGEERAFQWDAMHRLIRAVGDGPTVLTGDLNAPRGGAVFSALSRTMIDCIPANVTTSIDPHLHRAGPLELMVDGVFSTAHYTVRDVMLHDGLSDHCAISAYIEAARSV